MDNFISAYQASRLEHHRHQAPPPPEISNEASNPSHKKWSNITDGDSGHELRFGAYLDHRNKHRRMERPFGACFDEDMDNAVAQPSAVAPAGQPGGLFSYAQSPLPDSSILANRLELHGGPWVSPPAHSSQEPTDSECDEGVSDVSEDVDISDGHGVAVNKVPLPVPAYPGFQRHVMELNPGLLGPNNYLVDRIAHQMVSRHGRLLDLKTRHQSSIRTGSCSSGVFCVEKGGSSLPFGVNESTEDSGKSVRFRLNSDSFPVGIPRPPTSTLPAEFECQVCYSRLKLEKPSDWTRHVLDDVQHFTCTWDKCRDPRTFKTRADWVRHENEGHRYLEWWTCDVED
ncbi:Uu.00g099020.m01.CDS01 [Anthostomella pinea]|uniref:Uu.00g099020.m01.CDS01 n=1 Tax=Anthostomella pinea TaxID=933095 RepID=A0AAI8V7N0_9PEZI|nr:Uu.00g099020.m01.CDS01 [Anthostomella pinea]